MTRLAPTLACLLACVPACADDDGGGNDLDGTDDAGDGGGGGDDGGAAALTLANCEAAVDAAVPSFYQQYFACSDITVTGAGTQLFTTGLPPHPSAYYPADDPQLR